MAQNPLKRLLDAGAQFTEMSQSTAQRVVNDFVKAGEVRREEATKTVQALVDRGRQTSDAIIGNVQAEIAKQLSRFAERFDEMEDRVEQLAESVGIRWG